MATGIYLNDDEETYTVTFPGDDILTTVTSSGATAANWIVTTRQINQDLEWHSTFQRNIADRYFDGYCRLRSWAYNSLDSYKHELLCVLYPVFIHCFMDLVAEAICKKVYPLWLCPHRLYKTPIKTIRFSTNDDSVSRQKKRFPRIHRFLGLILIYTECCKGASEDKTTNPHQETIDGEKMD